VLHHGRLIADVSVAEAIEIYQNPEKAQAAS
jgi:hypothetical protein